MKKILCLSGGGAKGVLEVEILKELEKRGELENIDMILGSSVGAINGSILASGKLTMEQLAKIYPDMLKKVFKKKLISFPPIYDRKNFDKAFSEIIGNIYFSAVKIPLVISSIDFVEKRTHFFKSWEDGNERLIHIVEKSFAAPFYFSLLNDSESKKCWGDGGCGNYNIPIIPAILESIAKKWLQSEDVKFIIVGTGYSDISEKYEDVKKEGFVRELLDFMSPKDGGIARLTSRQEQIGCIQFLSKYFQNIHFDYYDIEIPKKLDAMDNIKAYNDYVKYGFEASKKPLISG